MGGEGEGELQSLLRDMAGRPSQSLVLSIGLRVICWLRELSGEWWVVGGEIRFYLVVGGEEVGGG